MAAPPLIYVRKGPNLNLPGPREPEIGGSGTFDAHRRRSRHGRHHHWTGKDRL